MGWQAQTNFASDGNLDGPRSTHQTPIFVIFRAGSPTSKLETFPLIQLKQKVRSFPAGSNSRKKY